MSRTVWWLAILPALPALGCVERKFVIESNVPNAQVYIDNRTIGAAPAYAPFEYYGFYNIKLVHPGFETVDKREHVVAPWYAYPPFDFVAEVLWPFPIRDTRRIYIEMHPAAQTRTDDILNAADSLRARGMALPPPERPAAPRPPRNPPPPPGPVIGPPVPGPDGVPVPLPGPGPDPGVIPNVTPG